MCSKLEKSNSMNGRGVLQPNNCNRGPLLERCNSIIPLINNSSSATMKTSPATIKRSISGHFHHVLPSSSSSSSFRYAIMDTSGSIAAARREQVANVQEQRKLRIAHYGRTSSSKSKPEDVDPSLPTLVNQDSKRCTFITPNSDPIYVAYHDQEWGLPVHDDKMLFELLVLTGAQVGSDWTSVLRKRQDFRDAFSGFDAQIVSTFSEKKMNGISNDYGIELSLVRGVVDNSKRILEINKEFGSFDKYLWGFVNHKAIVTQYKWCNKIPAKTSKSETISKDLVRRGFRLVGPTVIHSFMQAAGLTNDHLITCPTRHYSQPSI